MVVDTRVIKLNKQVVLKALSLFLIIWICLFSLFSFLFSGSVFSLSHHFLFFVVFCLCFLLSGFVFSLYCLPFLYLCLFVLFFCFVSGHGFVFMVGTFVCYMLSVMCTLYVCLILTFQRDVVIIGSLDPVCPVYVLLSLGGCVP